MPYFTIHYTADGRPYIIEKNYGHKPEREDSSSHWTWHITRDGVKHLARNNVIRPGHLPTYINDDELEDLKAYNMLARVNGERIGNQGLYPSDDPAWRRRMSERESSQSNPSYRKKKTPSTKPATAKKGSRQTELARQSKPKMAEIESEVEEQPVGFWTGLRAIFGKR